MATLDLNDQLSLLEIARRTTPKGDSAKIAEVLTKTNDVWGDMVWLEANGVTFHRTTRRTSRPAGTWRQLNAGVATEASTTETVDETIGLLESYSETDKWIIDNAPDPDATRMEEAATFIEGMGETLIRTLFERSTTTNYGDVTKNVERFNGLPVRLGTIQANGLVLNEGGSGADTTSIYIVLWGADKVFMVYPKGSRTIGIEHQNLGQVTVSSAVGSNANNTAQYEAYRDWFRMNCGLVVRDNRCIARLANIESSGTTNTFDEDNLIKIMNRMPNSGGGAILYCNPTIKTQMEIRLKDKTNVNFNTDNGLGGVPVLKFRGLPVHTIENILDTETAIS